MPWYASRLTLPEHQCKVHIAPYTYHGPMQFRVSEGRDPNTQQLVAIKNYINTYEQERTIWMDGRAHPPAWAPHTWMGFSTGKWQGNILTVYTTHIKQEWIRRNGVSNSDQSTTIEHFIRHGNILTHFMQWTDPVYLTEPYYRSEDFVLPSAPAAAGRGRASTSRKWSIGRRPTCRTTCPARARFSGDFAWRFGVPVEAARGGAETTYPEYHGTCEAAARLPQARRTKPWYRATPSDPPMRAAASVPPTAPAHSSNWDTSGDIHTFPRAGQRLSAGRRRRATSPCRPATKACWSWTPASPQHAEKVLAAIRKLSDKPIRYIINTQFRPRSRRRQRAHRQGGPHDRRRRDDDHRARERARAA